MNRGETLMTGRTDNSSGRPKSGKPVLACEQVYGLKDKEKALLGIPYTTPRDQISELRLSAA